MMFLSEVRFIRLPLFLWDRREKLQRSNSSKPSDSERISTFPTRILLFAMWCPPQAGHTSTNQGPILAQRGSIRAVYALVTPE
jgi:hypothetical protein